jgi:hypothetical protein
VTIYDPKLDATQQHERSPQQNPRSTGRARAIARHREISRGDGDERDATQDRGGPGAGRTIGRSMMEGEQWPQQ